MEAALPLICFPFAGAGASVFTELRRCAPDSIDVRPVQLPGRETRFGEPPLTTWTQVRRLLAEELIPPAGSPYAVYGHSLGGLVGYEFCALATAAGSPPAAFVVGGCGAPQPAAARLPSASEEARVTELIAALDPDLLEVLLPPLRADFQLYRDHEGATAVLDCPVMALWGSADEVTASHLAGWRDCTKGAFEIRAVEGEHLFVRDRAAEVMAQLTSFFATADAGASAVPRGLRSARAN